eukprot:8666257-Pyramimonas_sp.AAC.2
MAMVQVVHHHKVWEGGHLRPTPLHSRLQHVPLVRRNRARLPTTRKQQKCVGGYPMANHEKWRPTCFSEVASEAGDVGEFPSRPRTECPSIVHPCGRLALWDC